MAGPSADPIENVPSGIGAMPLGHSSAGLARAGGAAAVAVVVAVAAVKRASPGNERTMARVRMAAMVSEGAPLSRPVEVDGRRRRGAGSLA